MYELPENLSALSADELQALIDQGLDALRALRITDQSSEEDIVEGERIVGLLNGVRAEVATRRADTHRRDRAAALQHAATPESPEQPEPEQPETPETPEQPETLTPDEVIAPPEPVVASSSPARRAAANGGPPAVPAPRTEAVSLIAAADVPGFPTGAPLEGLSAVASAVLNRVRGLPTVRIGGRDGVRNRYGAAVIRKNGYGALTQDSERDDMRLVWEAGDERRLPGNSLVAAGGWCAPSETLYDLCQYETVDGILSIPEIQVTRGGIRWTEGPSFDDIYSACGFELTEQEAIAGTAQKDCCMVECPPFEEIRLDAVGLCVKTPLLTNAAYPELVRRFMEGALVAHQHKVNKYVIDRIAAAAGASTTLDDAGSLSITMANIELLAVGMRYRYRMSQTASIEVVAPFWLLTLLRMDIAMRQGVSPSEVTDAAINAWFSARNINVQWVYDFQDLQVDGCQVTVPDTVTVLMYPAGTWVKGSADVINVDAVYDSTGLSENVFTALFMEEGILAVQRCTHTCAVDVPICISGRVGAADITGCLTVGSTGGTGAIAATGATAGTPGTWTPAGSTAPASPGAMGGITASPTSAWTTGQYVQTATAGTAGRVYWNGTAWTTGAAP